MAKFGAILGPIAGAAVLSSGLPIVRSYALLAVCPAVLCLSGLGIASVVRGRAPLAPARAALVVAASGGSGDRS
jgi:AAHS family 4-hydroxybenzoate transporter-like MFS transporter